MVDLLWRVALRFAHATLLCWWFLTRPTLEGAFVALWVGERLLIVRNSYRKDLSLPSGGVERGEEPRAAAARELYEEVGIRVAPDDLRAVGSFTLSYEGKRDHSHFFELRLPEPPTIAIDHREVVEAMFLDEAELTSRSLVPHVRAYLAHVARSSPGAAPGRRDP